MAKLWPSPIRATSARSSEYTIYGHTAGGTYSALMAGMPAQQHIASVHNHRDLGANGRAVREPDGVPHDIVGLSALFSFLFAAVVLGMWLTGPAGRVAAVAMCMLGVPMLVSGLRRRSARERDELK